ncbi:AAA ATPase central domain protein [Chloroherpeton thalassium ATCC 35110]|uniref:Replication-associated recombination protein A n=1 Tax=Chloroherpeton thalassium (strain ATCC 35110 / GB-78) TaxID=517418 RepID=B3QTB9_CHLT3|nr:replication-associated recombination protein A [Chloroherpeton thalassium]ACF14218.1 AAA ATPase central domain protein [Chloroherpeton thalassium ATCC 35110]
MSDLFEEIEQSSKPTPIEPLAERMRPKTLDEVIGQPHLTDSHSPFRQFLSSGDFPSMILWGPPGVGKTTLALLLSRNSGYEYMQISAIDSGVKEVRSVITQALQNHKRGKKTSLFIDEIHRFNKAQQDALLGAVEKGTLKLIGATTENPSFEVIPALLSRSVVYLLKPLENEDIRRVVNQALESDEILMQKTIQIEAWDFLFRLASGDARRALNTLEIAINAAEKSKKQPVLITESLLEKTLQQQALRYDKKGDSHYDVISAFIKSLRGSDPDAALFWLAKMLDAGEDPKFIARRMIIFASEDIGNADTYALTLAVSVFRAVEIIGMPEARINLAQGVTYLASCKKSNASYLGIEKALDAVKKVPNASVPLHLRNAPTQLMKNSGFGKEYKYPHDFQGHFVPENYFPENLAEKSFYKPTEQGIEKRLKEHLQTLWKNRF